MPDADKLIAIFNNLQSTTKSTASFFSVVHSMVVFSDVLLYAVVQQNICIVVLPH